MAEGGIDVDAIVREIRAEAQKLREALPPENGASRIPTREEAVRSAAAYVGLEPTPASASSQLAREITDRLADLLDPRAVTLHSHRGRVGQLVVGAKRLLLRLLTPPLSQQAAFNHEVRDILLEMARAQEKLDARVSSIDRRVGAVETAAEASLGLGAMGALPFDYRAFEAEFRGSPDSVRDGQADYLDLFPDPGSGPVLDLGCGRGEFLQLLAARGISARGVDHDESMVAAAREALAGVVALGSAPPTAGGKAALVEVVAGDILVALDDFEDGSLGGITAFQVAEHLGLTRLARLLMTARRKLRTGGVLLLEVPNIASLIVHARAWTIDPTHHQPLHPLALRHLVAQSGFSAVELRFSHPVEPDLLLEGAGEDDASARNVARLNRVLFAPQDYAVVARA